MKIKSSTMDKVFVTCNTIFLVLFVTITLYPVLNTVALSFNDGIDAVRGGIHLWPRIFTLSNYKTVLHQQNILTGAVVSVARTVLGTIFSLVTNALLAYIISRKTLFVPFPAVFVLGHHHVRERRYDPHLGFVPQHEPDQLFLGIRHSGHGQRI